MKISGKFSSTADGREKFLVHSVAMMTKAWGLGVGGWGDLLSMDGDGAAAGRDTRRFEPSGPRRYADTRPTMTMFGTRDTRHTSYTSSISLCGSANHCRARWARHGMFLCPRLVASLWILYISILLPPSCEPCRIETLSIRQTAHGARTCGTRSSHLNLYVGELPFSASLRDKKEIFSSRISNKTPSAK